MSENGVSNRQISLALQPPTSLLWMCSVKMWSVEHWKAGGGVQIHGQRQLTIKWGKGWALAAPPEVNWESREGGRTQHPFSWLSGPGCPVCVHVKAGFLPLRKTMEPYNDCPILQSESEFWLRMVGTRVWWEDNGWSSLRGVFFSFLNFF